jgi:hypothetical protein
VISGSVLLLRKIWGDINLENAEILCKICWIIFLSNTGRLQRSFAKVYARCKKQFAISRFQNHIIHTLISSNMKTQSMIQKALIAIFPLTCTLLAQAGITQENQRKLDDLAQMTTTLKQEGVTGFLSKSSEQKWVAPKMYSTWFINKLPDDPEGTKLVETAKSSFGLEMALQLTLVAKIVRETRDTAILETQMDVLFATLTWLNTETAYSNMLLQKRADDIASIAATMLMCDIAYPMDKAENAMKRFDDRSWGSAERSRQVLFEESGGKHFHAGLLGKTQEDLNQEFREGVSLVLKLGSIVNRSDLEIFVEEVFRKGEAMGDLDNTWMKRRHIGFGGSVNLENLAQLHEFRRRYGKFPTKPVTIEPFKGESNIKAAFREISWENPYGIGGADDIYEAYLDGRLVDEVFRATDRRFNPNAK